MLVISTNFFLLCNWKQLSFGIFIGIKISTFQAYWKIIRNKINFSAPDATIHILEIDKWADLFLMLVFSTKNICMQLERDLFSALHILPL